MSKRAWQRAIEDTNKVAGFYIHGAAPEEALTKAFEVELKAYAEWGGPDPDKDWAEDTNR